MAQIVHLHGGPWHGQTAAIEDDTLHFHIRKAGPSPAYNVAPDEPATVPYQDGMYSKVLHTKNDFEWDGWRNHD